jgi:hypothetical protein
MCNFGVIDTGLSSAHSKSSLLVMYIPIMNSIHVQINFWLWIMKCKANGRTLLWSIRSIIHTFTGRQRNKPRKISICLSGCNALIDASFMLVSCLAYCLSLKMEVICSSEMWLTSTELYAVIFQKVELFNWEIVSWIYEYVFWKILRI